MRKITEKLQVERTARARGHISLSEDTRDRLTEDGVDDPDGPPTKGHLPTIARLAGLAWAKQVPALLPDAHPVDLTHADVEVETTDDGLRVTATCSAVDRTGVELEALASCLGSLFACWDVLKPYEKDQHGQYNDTRIHDVHVLEKQKASTEHHAPSRQLSCAIVVATDSRDEQTDSTGPALEAELDAQGYETISTVRVPDEVGRIRAAVAEAGRSGADLVIAAGGTGPSPRDVTPQAVEKLPGASLPGLTEGLRRWGQRHDGPNALLSRSVCRLVEAGSVRFVAMAVPGHPDAVRGLEPFSDPLSHAVDLWRKGT